jgi:prepilin-type N-terminal cleavage/methylation domain-containing protein
MTNPSRCSEDYSSVNSASKSDSSDYSRTQSRLESSHLSLSSGFTLIEVVIVVAILSVMFFVAIPNFGKNHIPRGRISRVRSDMRSLQVAIETYRLDHKVYPADHLPHRQIMVNGEAIKEEGMIALSTPVAYISALFFDPHSFDKQQTFAFGSGADADRDGKPINQSWVLVGRGPDGDFDTQRIQHFPWITDFYLYDPTNGLESNGDLVRFGGDYSEGTFRVEGEPWQNWKQPKGQIEHR